MQYILSEEEYKQGCELLESWREQNIVLKDVHIRSEELNKQGYFTLINCTNYEEELFEIVVFNRLSNRR